MDLPTSTTEPRAGLAGMVPRGSSIPTATARSPPSGPNPTSRSIRRTITASSSAATRLPPARSTTVPGARALAADREVPRPNRARGQSARDVQGRGLRAAAATRCRWPAPAARRSTATASSGRTGAAPQDCQLRPPQVQGHERPDGHRPAVPRGMDGLHQATPPFRARRKYRADMLYLTQVDRDNALGLGKTWRWPVTSTRTRCWVLTAERSDADV